MRIYPQVQPPQVCKTPTLYSICTQKVQYELTPRRFFSYFRAVSILATAHAVMSQNALEGTTGTNSLTYRIKKNTIR